MSMHLAIGPAHGKVKQSSYLIVIHFISGELKYKNGTLSGCSCDHDKPEDRKQNDDNNGRENEFHSVTHNSEKLKEKLEIQGGWSYKSTKVQKYRSRVG
jgi:hypothetical protein